MEKLRHYELIFLFKAEDSDQALSLKDKIYEMVEKDGGKVHRFEDWGRRQLAYPIQKMHKAHYVLFNIETTAEVLKSLKPLYQYNESVLRNFILQTKNAPSGDSAMLAEGQIKSALGSKSNATDKEKAPAQEAPKAES